MPHMLAQEHAGIYDCIRSGTARTQATIAAAIAAIGATPTLLTLTFAGDGVWSIASNLTIPANVTLHIPPGVTVNRASGVTLTIQGVVIASGTAWETGPGTTVRTSSALTEVSGVLTRNLSVVTGNVAGEGLFVSGVQGGGAIKRVRLYTEQGNGGVGIQMSQLDNNNSWNWQMYANTGGGISWGLAAANIIMHLLPTGLGLGPNNTPSVSYYLQLNGDFAAKPNGGSWTNPVSSRAFKDIHDNFMDGLEVLKKLQPVRFHYNGMCGMPTDQEFIGLVAEDVEEAAPYMLRKSLVRQHESDMDDTEVLGLNDGDLRFILRNAILELDARLQALEGSAPETPEETTPRSRRRTKE
jgi:Chaperone of endosialidase